MIRTPAFRFAGYYGAFYLMLGCFLPYFPQWLDGRGLSPEWIGWIVAAGMAGRTLVSPVGARWSDRAVRRRDPILVFAIGCVVVFGLHGPAATPWVLLILSFLSGALVFGQIPVIDAFAMRAARGGAFTFGPVRAIGSAAFIIANFSAGALIDRFGTESILVWLVLAAGLLALAAAWLPEGRRAEEGRTGRGDLREIGRLVIGPLGIALAASAMVQAGHGFYYAFSAKAWSEQGLPGAAIGALWASGVAVEIAFLWLSGRGLLGRASPALLLGVGSAASVVRWGLTALSPPLWALFLLQSLHALTFAATYVGFLRFASEHVPDDHAALAQALNSALSGGLVMAAASAVSGYFYARIGAGGFAVMILPALCGLGAAVLLHRVQGLPRREKID
ncbi:MFS transporter [Maricaulis sp.]|uniref:MFS transporter n=1 Tax=Maricaulis sp. TaxID=1486257 RepID=UPI00261204A0|nr:MFS transporter [Maricaulis sp.]